MVGLKTKLGKRKHQLEGGASGGGGVEWDAGCLVLLGYWHGLQLWPVEQLGSICISKVNTNYAWRSF